MPSRLPDRSERHLMRHAADRLSVLWYLGYDLGEALPDHSSLTRIRERYGVEIFRRFFDAIVEQCQQEKLVWGRELYVDSTQVNANADLDSLTPRFAVEARAAIQAHLAALFLDADSKPEPQQAVTEVIAAPPECTSLEVVCPAPTPLPVTLCEPEQEELTQDNAARHDWIAEQGRLQREVRGYYQRTSDLRISTTDPDATPMRLKGGGTHLGYHVHYVVDGGKARVILQVLVTPAEVMDNQPMRDLIFRARFRWKLRPRHVSGDTKYGTLQNIKALEDAGIRAYVPLPDWEHKTPLYGPSKFTYDAAQDRYICPAGQPLRRFRIEYQAEKVEYRADAATCNACPLKTQCTDSQQGRQLHRYFHAHYLERVQSYHQTAAYQKAMRKRQVWVEPLFAEAKDWHGMRRFRLRLLWRVNCEALRIAAGQNLKRLLKKRGWGRQPFPAEAMSASFWGLLHEVFVLMLEKGDCWCLLVRFPQYRERHACLFADELTEDFFNRLVHLQDRFRLSRNMTTMRKFWTIALLLHRLYEKCYAIIRRVSFSEPLGSVSSLAGAIMPGRSNTDKGDLTCSV